MDQKLIDYKEVLSEYIKHSESASLEVVLKVREYRLDNQIFYHVYVVLHNEEHTISDAIPSLDLALGRVSFLEKVASMMFSVKEVYSKVLAINEEGTANLED